MLTQRSRRAGMSMPPKRERGAAGILARRAVAKNGHRAGLFGARGARLRPPGYGEAGKPSRYTFDGTRRGKERGGLGSLPAGGGVAAQVKSPAAPKGRTVL